MASTLPANFGPYILLDVLGRGGKGTAYLAVPIEEGDLPSPLVVKVLHPDAASDPLDRERFEHEAKLAVAIDVEALATVYDAGLAGGTAYIAMELVRGMSLSRLFLALAEQNAMLALDEALAVAISLLSGLKQLHEARDEKGRSLEAIHRDLSPTNVMLERSGRIRLLDLGIGRSRLRDEKTATGVIVGTPGYMSPEQVLSAPISQRSDVYTVGAIFWELLTGRRYIARGELAIVLAATAKRVFEPPSSIRPSLSTRFDEVCRRALDRDPAKRYANAAEFLQAIEPLRPLLRERASEAILPLSAVFSANPVNELALSAFTKTRTEARASSVIDTVVVARRPPPSAPDTVLLAPPQQQKRSWVWMLPVLLAGFGLAYFLQRPPAVTAVLPAEPQESPRDPEIRAAERPSIQPREQEREPDPEPLENAPAPIRKNTPRAAIDRPADAAPTFEQLVARLHQRAGATKRARPELAAAADQLLNTGLFEAAAGDTPAVRARLAEILGELERLAAR